MRKAAALAALLLAVGVASAQSPVEFTSTLRPEVVQTTLYFHPMEFWEMPINTQRPVYDEGWTGVGTSPPTATMTCLDGPLGGLPQGATSQEFHTYYGFSTPSFVVYGEHGPSLHPVRALGFDVPLAQDPAPVLHWYMAEDPADPAQRTAPLVNVRVQVTVRAGDAISVDDNRYDSGPILMQGATAPVTALSGQVVGDGASQVTAQQVAGRWVYGFAIPLELEADKIQRATGFNVRIDVLLDNAACDEGTIMLPTVVPFADPDRQPRMLVAHAQPLRAEYLHPVTVGSDLVIHTSVNSPWGNYDVAVEDARLTMFGPSDVQPVHNYTVQRYLEHFHLVEPVDQGWVVKTEDVADGRYTTVYTVPNLQRTADLEAQVSFYVQDGQVVQGPPRESPGLPLLALVAALAMAFVLRRRAQ